LNLRYRDLGAVAGTKRLREHRDRTVATRMSDTKGVREILEDRSCPPALICVEIARIFGVKPTEVGLLALEDTYLEFLFPTKLQAAGSIPMSSSAVAARTAVAAKAFLFNRFPLVPHHTVFERIKLDDSEPLSELPDPIQKLMSAPIIGEDKRVMGVVQVCRKGMTAALSGADFAEEELERLVELAKVIAPYLPELKLAANGGARVQSQMSSEGSRKRASA
jgi:hypothetical protein